MTKTRDCMQNFNLLSQLLGPNADCTKFGVTECRNAPPLIFLKGESTKFNLLERVVDEI